MARILVVDDEQAVCWVLERALTKAGHQVRVAASAEEALELAAKLPFDAVILDVRLPGMDGLTALARLRERTGDAPTVVITAHGNLTTAVRAVQEGAFDYLAKPFDLDQALDAVARALARGELPEPGTTPVGPDEPGDIVGRCPAMQVVFKRIALVAPRDSSVLITGESGTGKELVARALHAHSPRRDRPFLPVHIAALNPQLVESELFGHVKGAFTGAAEARPGLLELADGGTVFLDELGDIPPGVQVKLLRALETGEVLPVGGTVPRRLDVRLLAATHQDLARLVAEGRFRHDLYFRLNVFQIHLPPLRERPGDVALLAEHFLRRLEPAAGPLPEPTLRHLEAQSWPGNVRELRNALEHAAIVARGGPLLPEHFPAPLARPPAGPAARLTAAVADWLAPRLDAAAAAGSGTLYQELLDAAEPGLLAEVVRRAGGNRLKAALWLGLNRATVRKKLRQYGLDDAPGDE